MIVGHSHIDAEWLWTREETIEVCRETFKNVLSLMEKYHQLKYVQSSSQYYAWMEEHYPQLFEEIRRRVEEGRWEPVAPWVEFDANMPCGESLVRQLLYSKQYFKEKLGFDAEVVWLPDTFGFPQTLPQIMAGLGFKYFLTQKLNWNDTVKFRYNYFWWESPDGSRVLAHQTLGGYGGIIEEDVLWRLLQSCSKRHGFTAAYVMIGYGDHGGGLSEEMIKSALKIIEQREAVEASFTSPSEFFKWLEKLAEHAELPVWRGELYLQYHRGTYTTQARFKKIHREVEVCLLEAERIASVASWYGYPYPKAKLRELWLKLLFNQFHDILAGSSIPEVYERAERELEEVRDEARRVAMESAKYLASGISAPPNSPVAFNTLMWDRVAVIAVDGDFDIGGIVQRCGDSTLLSVNIPSMGYKVIKRGEFGGVEVVEEDQGILLENGFFKALVDRRTGALLSLEFKGIDLIDGSRGGVHVQIFKDEPIEGRITLGARFDAEIFDAWEVYIFQQPEGVVWESLGSPESLEVVEKGPVRASVRVRYRFKQQGRPDSMFTITYRAYAGVPWLELDFKVEWHAKHRFAKLMIPLSYKSEYAKFDQAYGWIERRSPLSPSATLEERAKWEVPGHMWADVSRGDGVGLAVLDDGKYGYDFGCDFIRVSLLRSASYPPPWGRKWEGEPPITDQGLHEFRIALMPHSSIPISEIVKRAFEFNCPAILVRGGGGRVMPQTRSFLRVEGIVGVVLKEAEDGRGYILRGYEVDGRRARVGVSVDRMFSFELANLAEEQLAPLGEGREVEATARRYGIVTLRLVHVSQSPKHGLGEA